MHPSGPANQSHLKYRLSWISSLLNQTVNQESVLLGNHAASHQRRIGSPTRPHRKSETRKNTELLRNSKRLMHASYEIARFKLHTNRHEITFSNYRPQLKTWGTFFPPTGNNNNNNNNNNTSHYGDSQHV